MNITFIIILVATIAIKVSTMRVSSTATNLM